MNVIINFFPLEMFLLRWVHKIPKFPLKKQDSRARRNINHEKRLNDSDLIQEVGRKHHKTDRDIPIQDAIAYKNSQSFIKQI